MGAERVTVIAKIGNTVLRFQGAKWFYNDSDIRSKCGLELLNEATLDDGDIPISGKQAKKYLLRLVAVLKGDGVGGVGNAAQNDKSYRYEFYCDPEKGESAMTGLLGKSVDQSLLPGNYKITEVYRKLQISYA